MFKYLKYAGFSLIELLTSLCIISILMTISFPALRNFLLRTQDEILQQELSQMIQFAKRESAAYRTSITLCPTENQKTCSGNFSDGYLVFADSDQQIILVKRFSAKHGATYWRTYQHYRDYLSFSPEGFMQSDNGTFWHCHHREPMWGMMMNKTGYTHIVYPNKNGDLIDTNGKIFKC